MLEKYTKPLALSFAATSLFIIASAQAGELTIYSSVEADNLKVFSEQFAKAHPDIKINWVRDSTGVIQARVIAEKENPRNDVFFGHAATDLLALDQMGMFMPYQPKGADKLDPRYRDKKAPPTWTGLWGFAAAVCFNTVEAAKRNIPQPTKWVDLANPVYKGQITMPNPISSGTGFLNVAGWMQIMGKDKAWSFMDQLHGNIASYTHSGSKPCNQVAAGEYVVGISLPGRAADLKTRGAPIMAVIPEDGIGWEMQGVAIMKGTKNAADAKTFVDWSVSEAAMESYAARVEVVAFPVKTPMRENMPREVSTRMINNDFAWAATNKTEILDEWRKRYDSKTEPKK
ncbi:putative 2-aminoethylphosphonate ABC transporter substrate-binding protein [Ferrovibrio sp.]|uniref:putative 2-aminoethylphosphonate ABC transporter substrate-binding protein n=1 Tax=Ferrovibrio sp. TaxID=1917215 RepID=UPI0025C2E40F|nr:putative 2-aminoethylphosphonate ABC transporter substrate-binding protein [Ferrovibrio sp.]MBX3454091.1 putative 2-aminoethylphosphonate ABC transporter substrate-binding protein [Ferrovibrio sp.]